MQLRGILITLAGTAVLVVLALTAYWSQDVWRAWFASPDPSAGAGAEAHGHAHGARERIHLSPQARGNLRLVVQPIQLQTYWRSLDVPGAVVERQGRSDRGVTAPLAGVVRRVAAFPGDTVRPGDELLTLRLNSESVQNSQTELYKTTRELQITAEQRKRLEPLTKDGVVAEARILELDYQQRRLTATSQALRYDLAARGLTSEQIQGAAEGKFVTEITIQVPGKDAARTPADADTPASGSTPLYEVEELKVQLGDQVQSGQTLATLANHQALFVEGRVFRHEASLVERAAQKGWPVRAVFPGEQGDAAAEQLKIRFLANRVDPVSRTVPVYAPLANEYREYTEDGKTYRIWRYRPGQRVRLHVPVEPFEGVFVLPAEAVVREGADVYVFRANGHAFDRKPVHVLYEDRQAVVVAHDGSVNVGNHVAHNGAAALNRILKAQAAGADGHGHDHHGHSH